MKNAEIGKIGENLALEYLINKGYLILARNHHEGFGEIDIIVRHPNGILAFCEVKAARYFGRSWDGLMPEDNLSFKKRRKMVRASQLFLAKHPNLVRGNAGWQMDLIAVVLKDGAPADIRHYENI